MHWFSFSAVQRRLRLCHNTIFQTGSLAQLKRCPLTDTYWWKVAACPCSERCLHLLTPGVSLSPPHPLADLRDLSRSEPGERRQSGQSQLVTGRGRKEAEYDAAPPPTPSSRSSRQVNAAHLTVPSSSGLESLKKTLIHIFFFLRK